MLTVLFYATLHRPQIPNKCIWIPVIVEQVNDSLLKKSEGFNLLQTRNLVMLDDALYVVRLYENTHTHTDNNKNALC